MKELVQKVIQWAEDRNIIEGAKKTDQLHKLYQECGELSDSLCKGKCAKDDIGDITVVLIILAAQCGFNFNYDDAWIKTKTDKGVKLVFLDMMEGVSDLYDDIAVKSEINSEHWIYIIFEYVDIIARVLDYDVKECLQIAYDDIKDRKGVLRDGVWVKEADL